MDPANEIGEEVSNYYRTKLIAVYDSRRGKEDKIPQNRKSVD